MLIITVPIQNKTPLKLLKLLVKTSYPLFIGAIFFSFLTGLSASMVIKYIHSAVKEGISDSQLFFSVFIIFIILYGLFAVISSYTVAILTQNTIHYLRMTLSKKILQANFQKMEYNQKKILPVLTFDIQTLSYTVDQLPHVLTSVATILGVYVYLFWDSWQITLISLVILFVLIFPLLKYTLPLMSIFSEKARNTWNALFSQFDGLVYGLKELTLNKRLRGTYIDESLSQLSKEQNRYSVKENLMIIFSQKSMDIVLFISIGLMLFLVMQYEIVEYKVFGQFLMILLMTFSSFSTISGFFSRFKRAEVALTQIQKLGLEIEKNIKPKQEILFVENWDSNKPIIELKSVSHQYYHQEEDRHFILGPLDLSIYENEIIFVVGGNGSGKTTFAKLLTGLYKPKEGNLYFKGVNISWSLLDKYRNYFAGLYTDFYLFENISYIPKKNIKENYKKLLSLLLLEEKVTIKDGKFSTIKLSQGQMKRLALMTAIIEDKEIYLFDEWAANQDPQFKSIFYNQILLDLKKKGKTCIVISHDENYFKHGDRILKIIEGQLIEEKQISLSS